MALSLQRYTWIHDDYPFHQILKQRITKEKERSVLITIDKIDHLPESLIAEILSWLPVKDLLQFKIVCKSWYAILSSPDFVSKHLINYYNNNNHTWCGCLLVQYYITHAELMCSELLLDETPRVLAHQDLDFKPMHSSLISGPCHGLYYLFKYNSDRALWNPAINEFKTLPHIICKPDLPSSFTYAPPLEVYGFGMDPTTGVYKVVVLKGYCNDNDDGSDLKHPVSVLVYSLRSNSWRYCGDLDEDYDLENNTCYIYVNGCCYWLGSLEYSLEVIISFDFATDTFKEIDVPDYAQPSSKCLAVYDDSLAFLSLHDTYKNLDIFTWSDGCWTKKFTIGPFSDLRCPLGHWKDTMLLLQDMNNKLFLLDLDTQELKDLAFETEMWCKGVYTYMESLVSIKGKKCEVV